VTELVGGDRQGRMFAVVGATGQQGGATVRALQAQDAGVRALVRDPQAPAARALADGGVQVVRADIDDAESLRRAFTDVDGVFAMTTYAGPAGTSGEVEHGKRIADAAAAARVPHVVYSSVGGAERRTGIPHFESKRRVEEYLSALGLPTTFIRPTFFMDNFARSGPQPEGGFMVLRLPLAPDVPLQMICVDDIGVVAAAALLERDRVPGGTIEIAGDELTGEQIAAVYGQHFGLPARFDPLPLDVLAQDPDRRAMFAWFNHLPSYEADFSATKDLAPAVKSLTTWLESRD